MTISLKQIKASGTGKRYDCMVEIGDWLFADEVSRHRVRVLSAEPLSEEQFQVLIRRAGKDVEEASKWSAGKKWRRYVPAAPVSVLFQPIQQTEQA